MNSSTPRKIAVAALAVSAIAAVFVFLLGHSLASGICIIAVAISLSVAIWFATEDMIREDEEIMRKVRDMPDRQRRKD